MSKAPQGNNVRCESCASRSAAERDQPSGKRYTNRFLNHIVDRAKVAKYTSRDAFGQRLFHAAFFYATAFIWRRLELGLGSQFLAAYSAIDNRADASVVAVAVCQARM